MTYSTLLGGTAEGSGNAVAVDAEGNCYVTGTTTSAAFPVTLGALQSQHTAGSRVTFVSKLNPSGTALIYSTYLGGSLADSGNSIAVDSLGHAYVAGTTGSRDFPIANAIQPTCAHCGDSTDGGSDLGDAFVTKLSLSGSTLEFSTYLGGSSREEGKGIAVDSSGDAYVTGTTSSVDFPTANPFQGACIQCGSANPLSRDVFVTKITADGSALLYSTYLGGAGDDVGNAIALSAAGEAIVAGYTQSINFPTARPFQSNLKAAWNAFVTKLDSSGKNLVYSTYLGGSSTYYGDAVYSVAVDSSGVATLAGYTGSTDFPISPNAFQSTKKGTPNAFISRLSPDGSALLYSTYLGGSAFEEARAVAVDSAGNVYVTGDTCSSDFPLKDPLQADVGRPNIYRSSCDVFLTKLNPSRPGLQYSTYLGGKSLDSANGIAVDLLGNVYITGVTGSLDLPLVSPLQSSLTGTEVPFVAKVSEGDGPLTATLFVPIVLSAAGVNHSFFTTELTLTNRGSREARLKFTYTSAFGEGRGSGMDSLPAGRQRIIPDAISYLKDLGVPLAEGGDRGGTLRIEFAGISHNEAAVLARTTTQTPSGRAGLAYQGVPVAKTLTRPAYLCGLRQNETDRSNVAIQNAGTSEEGDVELRLTVFPGDPRVAPLTLPDEKLAPGEFQQFNSVLGPLGFSQGYVRVERVSGKAPFYAYAVINDQRTSDGSFVPPVEENAYADRIKLTVPALVETGTYTSELILTNYSGAPKVLNLSYVAEAVQAEKNTATLSLSLAAGEQVLLPGFVQYIRDQGAPGVGPPEPVFAGALFISPLPALDTLGLFAAARTSSAGDGGHYGVFYGAVPYGPLGADFNAWVFGLRQDGETRSKLALINNGEGGDYPFGANGYEILIFNGETGAMAARASASVETFGWLQIEDLLKGYAPGVKQGYVWINGINSRGQNSFVAYGVINDGAVPGERTGDGAFISSSP